MIIRRKRSRQPRYNDAKYDTGELYYFITQFAKSWDNAPEYGTKTREKYLSQIWRQEPILSGAIFAMVSKSTSWDYDVQGSRNKKLHVERILDNSENGKGWHYLFSKAVLAFLTSDIGCVIEKGFSDPYGSHIDSLYNIDPTLCELSGDPNVEVVYKPNGYNPIEFDPTEAFRVCSMPQIQEKYLDRGFCAVSRALRSANLLMKLHQHKEEKLENLPPQGIATITGLTVAQVKDALREYAIERTNRNQQTFPGLLWLVGNNISSGTEVKFTEFSTLPDWFDEKVAVEIYAKTLALSFGVDVSEIWQVEHTGATKANVTIQHTKSKGKGPAEIATAFERAITRNVCPDGVNFTFGSKDAEELKAKAEVDKISAITVMSLYDKGQGVISRSEARDMMIRVGLVDGEEVFRDDEYGYAEPKKLDSIKYDNFKVDKFNPLPPDELLDKWGDYKLLPAVEEVDFDWDEIEGIRQQLLDEIEA